MEMERKKDISSRMSSIGLNNDLSFLKELGDLSLLTTIQQLNMEINLAEEDIKQGKKVRWCVTKKMILNDNDCSTPCFGHGCHHWNGECRFPEEVNP